MNEVTLSLYIVTGIIAIVLSPVSIGYAMLFASMFFFSLFVLGVSGFSLSVIGYILFFSTIYLGMKFFLVGGKNA